MSVSFGGTAEVVLSFEAGTTLTAGYPVALSGNKKVSNAADGAVPMGIALHERCGVAAVQLKGYVELPYSGTAPALGWSVLVSNGAGGVKTASAGLSCLVINVDTAAKTVGLYL